MTEAQRREYMTRKSLVSLTHNLDPKIQLPPIDIIGGIFPRAYVSMLFAPPGTGKTIFIQKFCSDLSMGGSIYGGVAEDEPKRVSLILAGEDGYELLIRRSAAMKWNVAPEKVKIVNQYEGSLQNISLMLDTEEGFNKEPGKHAKQEAIDKYNAKIQARDARIQARQDEKQKQAEAAENIGNARKLWNKSTGLVKGFFGLEVGFH